MRPSRPPLRAAWCAFRCALPALAALTLATDLRAEGTASGGHTRIRIDARIAHDLGLEASPGVIGAGRRFPIAPGARLAISGAPGDVEGFGSGRLRHQGFLLFVHGATLDLDPFDLGAGASPLELELRDAAGRAWLRLASPHPRRVPDGIELRNADLLIAPQLADALGRRDLAGTYVGVAEADWLATGEDPLAGGGSGGCDLGVPPTNVELNSIESLTQAYREPGGRIAMAPAATLRNSGSAAVSWFQAIAPDAPTGPHPFLVLHLYRLWNGALEQIGRADVKHAFFAVNNGCACPPSNVLYPGCSDSYGVTTNLDRYRLAPRTEVTARTASWSSLGSHFDATPINDMRDHGGDAVHDPFEHRLVVQEPDLQTPGARYFVEAWYLAAGDVNLLDSLGHREVAPLLIGSTFSFPFLDSSLAQGSILDVFVNPMSPGPGEASELLDTGSGRLQLAVRAVDLGGGLYRYEYALMNFDFDAQVRAFSVPLVPGSSLAAPVFRDGDADASNDWSVEATPESVSFVAPPSGALDWGELCGFAFETDRAPGDTQAWLTPLEGAPIGLAIDTLGPAPLEIPPLPAAWRHALGGIVLAAIALASSRRGLARRH